MRIWRERGRFFNARDDERAPAVAVIDSSFAQKYFPGQDPVGKRLHLALLEIQPEIVGVIGHVEHWGLGSREHQDLQSQIYLSIWQLPDHFWSLLANGVGWVTRTTGAPASIVSGIREAEAKVHATAATHNLRPMQEIVANSIAKQRLTMILLSVFSTLALALSPAAIYPLLSHLTPPHTPPTHT